MSILISVGNDDFKAVEKNICKENVNSVDEGGNSSIHYAAINGNIPMITLLCKNGINVNLQNKKGLTALHLAAKDNFIDVFLYLVNHGAIYDLKSEDKKTPLDVAKEYDNQAIIDCVKELDDFYDACEKSDGKRIKKYINEGISPNIRFGKNGYTPLHYLTAKGHVDIINFVLDNDGDVNIMTSKYENALHLAMKAKNVNIVKLYMDYANINQRGGNGETYLHYSSRINTPDDILKLLFEYGINPYLENNDGQIATDIKKSKLISFYMKMYERSKKSKDYKAWIKKFVSSKFEWGLERIINRIKLDTLVGVDI